MLRSWLSLIRRQVAPASSLRNRPPSLLSTTAQTRSGTGRGDGDADLAQRPVRQALVAADILPRVAAVSRLEQPAVRAAARQHPRDAAHLPDGGVEHAGVAGVQADVDGAGVLAHEEHALPGIAAVHRPEDAALLVRPEGVSERRDVDDVGILGVHPHGADLAALAQADVGPRLAAVGRLVDAVALSEVGPDAALPRAHVDDVGVRLCDADGADRRRGEEAVGHVAPEGAAIVRLPHAADAGAEVEHLPVGRMPGDGHGPAAPERADAPPPEHVEMGRVDWHSRFPFWS